ncbi:MAG: hypothetical protein KDH98_15160 [Calditrichaeota bacterium]|nr:hypothetical protein [Calditrichota bacterium]
MELAAMAGSPQFMAHIILKGKQIVTTPDNRESNKSKIRGFKEAKRNYGTILEQCPVTTQTYTKKYFFVSACFYIF